jgi:hypothetical protein
VSFNKFFASISPSLERDRIVRSLEKAFKAIETTVLPSVQFEDKLVADQRVIDNLDTMFKSSAEGYRGQPITFIRMVGQELVSNRSKILDIFERSFNKEIQVDAIDYKKAHLIEYAAAIAFYVEYTQKLVFAVTAAAVKNVYQKQGIVEEFTQFCSDPAAIRSYAIICGALFVKPEKLSVTLDKLKSISYDPDSHDIMVRMKGKEVDPMQMNMIPLIGHISLLFGEMINAAFDHHLKRSEEILQSTQLHIYYLERQKEGASEDELKALEKQIAYYRERVAKLEARIEGMRE